MTTAPRLDLDIFSDEILNDPWSSYRTIRDAGTVVRLEQEHYDVYAVGRFEDVRNVLRDWHQFTSAEGTGFNELANDTAKSTIVGCDPPIHGQLRTMMNERLRLSEVKELTRIVQAKADELVRLLLGQGRIDVVKDMAERLVPAVVGELVGIEGDALYAFATGGGATFEAFGPPNSRVEAAFPNLLEQVKLIGSLTKDDMVPGSMGWHLYDASDRGELPEDMCTALLLNYVGPGFETTINAIGNALWMLGRDPEQWKYFKDGTTSVHAVINETLRMEAPIHTWARFCYEDADVGGVTVPGGSRLAVLIASGNRDERHYADPDHFEARRDPIDHLSFGHGIHSCIGANLAKAQLTAVLTAVVEQVTTLEVGEAVRRLNNTTRGLGSLPATIS